MSKQSTQQWRQLFNHKFVSFINNINNNINNTRRKYHGRGDAKRCLLSSQSSRSSTSSSICSISQCHVLINADCCIRMHYVMSRTQQHTKCRQQLPVCFHWQHLSKHRRQSLPFVNSCYSKTFFFLKYEIPMHQPAISMNQYRLRFDRCLIQLQQHHSIT